MSYLAICLPRILKKEANRINGWSDESLKCQHDLNLKRELVALLCLSSRCLVMVVWRFLVVPWVCLRFVIVVFSDHTHLLFLTKLGA